MTGTIGLLFDILILGALIVAIRQAWRLNRDFERMQADRKVFESLIAALNIATSRAEGAITGLREAASEGGDQLQEKINKGRELAHELDIMIQAGDNLANRLTQAAEQKRSAVMASPSQTTPPLSRAEKELLEALQARQSQG